MDRRRRIVKSSGVIISFLMLLSDWVYRKISGSIAALVFTGYEKCEGYYRSSFFYRVFQGYEPGVIKNIVRRARKAIIIGCENSLLISGVKNCADNLLALRLHTIGAFFISFGFYSAIMYLLKIYVLDMRETLAIDLIAGVSLAACGGVLAFSKQSLYQAVRGSSICNALLFRFFGFSEKRGKDFAELTERNANSRPRNIIGVFTGLVLGAATYFVSPVFICAAIAALAVLYAVLCYPEAGFLALLFMAPLTPPGSLIILAGVCVLVGGAYFIKLARGKRAFGFEILDLFVLMFCVLIFFGGFVSVSRTGSIRPGLIYLCFTLIYFAGANMIKSREMIMRCVAALAVSCFIVAAFGVYQHYFGVADNIWLDAAMFAGIGGRVVSTLENPNVLATYLLLIMPFVIVAAIFFKQMKLRAPLMAGLALTVLCLAFTWSRGSWLAFIIAALLLFVILDRRVLALYAAAVLAVPFAPAVLPETVMARFLSIGNIADSSTSYRVSIWQGTLRMLRVHFFEGIGIGVEPYRLVYPAYALAGIESAPHSHSLYLQLNVEFGIVGLVVFLLLAFFFVQCCFTAMKKAGEQYLRLFTAAGLCAVAGFMLNGFTDLVWYNYRVYLMFWLVLAVTVGICRFALKNQPEEYIK